MGLDYGADDYIVKPFSPGEVIARVRAVLRRMEKAQGSAHRILCVVNLVEDLDNYGVSVEGQHCTDQAGGPAVMDLVRQLYQGIFPQKFVK